MKLFNFFNKIESLEEGKVRVCDFGVSVVKQKTAPTYGSPGYAAPELGTPNSDRKVDVYSFAIWYK